MTAAIHLRMFFAVIMGTSVLLTLLSCTSYLRHCQYAHHFVVNCLLGAIAILYHLLKAAFHPRMSEQELKLSETIIQHSSHIFSGLVFKHFTITEPGFLRSHPVCVSLPLRDLLDRAIKFRNACRFLASWSIRA